MTKEFLRGLPLFADLSDKDLDWLSAKAEPVTIQAGRSWLKKGRQGMRLIS